MTRFLISFIAIAMLFSLWLIFKPSSYRASENEKTIEPEHSYKRHDFILPDLDGQQQSFSQWYGKVVLLNFWATWCPPCRREMPDFIDVYNQYKNRDFIVIGVGVDDEQHIRQFVRQLEVNYPILVGGKAAMQVSYQYGNRHGALPYSIIIDKQGIIRYRAGGLISRQQLLQQITPLL